MTKPNILVSPGLRGETAYRVPAHAAPVDLPLHGNEGATPEVDLLEALTKADIAAVRRYPSAAPLEAALAQRYHLEPDQVLVTAGADDALDRAFRTFLWPGREVVLPAPTFVMLERFARLAGATVREVAWDGGAFPVHQAIGAIGHDTGVVAVVSPNNPTGAVATDDDLRRLSEAAPHAALLVDLAYGEYAERDLTATALTLPNAIVFRTLSKAWGLAGARVGYAMGPAHLLAFLRAAGLPYAVSGPSVLLGLRRLATGADGVGRHVGTVRGERCRLAALLRKLGVQVEDSHANFVLARFPDAHRARWLRDALAGLGIGVRAFPGRPTLEQAVRITCPGDEGDFQRLCHGIVAALSPDDRVVEDLDALRALPHGRPAWYFGRRAAELREARDRGVVPIGLSAADADPPDALARAGAARVVRGPDDLEGAPP